MTARGLYERERARQLKAQARSRPADPQAVMGGPAALAYRDMAAAPCFCGHSLLLHQTGNKRDVHCSVMDAGGRCGCGAYARAHDWGSDEKCRACEVESFLDTIGPCPGRPR